ncbi:MAG: hypothetical protein AB8H79_23385 [Myxococcota bacterium]
MDPIGLSCAALAAAWPYTPIMPDAELPEEACFVVHADVAGRLSQHWPDPGIATQAGMARSRLELGVLTRHGVGARVAIDGRRSAPDTSFIGLEGESFYMRLQIAEASYALPQLGLVARAGLIDDPWVITGNQTWGFRGLAATLSEAQLWSERSDGGASLTWTAPRSTVQVTGSILTGEGLQRRERNSGKDAHLLVRIRPLAFTDADRANQLAVDLYARNGSKGTALVRNHRVGARVHGGSQAIRGGASVSKVWGLGGDAEATPWGGETWGTADVGLFTSAVRAHLVDQQPGVSQHTDVAGMVAVGLRPPNAQARPGYFMIGVEHAALGELSAPVSGAAGTQNSTMVFAQLGVDLRAGGSLSLPSVRGARP